MSQRQPRRPAHSSMPRRRSSEGRRGCLGQFVAIGIALLVIVALYALLARPAIGSLLGAQLGERLGLPAANAPSGQAAVDGAAAVLPGAIAALPPGEIVLREDEANAFFASRQGDYAPIDEVALRFIPGQVVAEVVAYGLAGTARSGLAAENGRVVLLDPQLDGALGLAVSGGELAAPLAERLNAELARQNRRVEEVRVEAGQIVLVTTAP